MVRNGDFVIGRKEFKGELVVECGGKSLGRDIRYVVGGFDVGNLENRWTSIWIFDLITDVVILYVHKLRTFKSHLFSVSDVDSGLVVAEDVSHGDRESELIQ